VKKDCPGRAITRRKRNEKNRQNNCFRRASKKKKNQGGREAEPHKTDIRKLYRGGMGWAKDARAKKIKAKKKEKERDVSRGLARTRGGPNEQDAAKNKKRMLRTKKRERES